MADDRRAGQNEAIPNAIKNAAQKIATILKDIDTKLQTVIDNQSTFAETFSATALTITSIGDAIQERLSELPSKDDLTLSTTEVINKLHEGSDAIVGIGDTISRSLDDLPNTALAVELDEEGLRHFVSPVRLSDRTCLKDDATSQA